MYTFNKQIRSVLELAAIVWTAGLTKDDIRNIERVQKSACSIVLGSRYTSYEEALTELNMKTLAESKKVLSMKFAKKQANTQYIEHGLLRTIIHMIQGLRRPSINQYAPEQTNS